MNRVHIPDSALSVLALGALLSVLFAGCKECKSTGDCPLGHVCQAGQCMDIPSQDTGTDGDADVIDTGDTPADGPDVPQDTPFDGTVPCTTPACSAFCTSIGEESGYCQDDACWCVGSDVPVEWDVAPDYLIDEDASDPASEWECSDHADCFDGNTCTMDLCSPVTHECAFLPVVAGYDCDDGLFCNGLDTCSGDVCMPGGDPCPTVEPVCNPKECNELTRSCGATPAEDGDPCDDSNWCNGPDECQEGICVRPGPQPCPIASADPCMMIICDGTAHSCGETAKPDGMLCADEDPCNGVETCVGGECQSAAPPCEDGDPCTDDLCDPGDGSAPPSCTHNPIC